MGLLSICQHGSSLRPFSTFKSFYAHVHFSFHLWNLSPLFLWGMILNLQYCHRFSFEVLPTPIVSLTVLDYNLHSGLVFSAQVLHSLLLSGIALVGFVWLYTLLIWLLFCIAQDLVKRYSEFINFPIYLWATKEVEKEVPADDDESSDEEETSMWFILNLLETIVCVLISDYQV